MINLGMSQRISGALHPLAGVLCGPWLKKVGPHCRCAGRTGLDHGEGTGSPLGLCGGGGQHITVRGSGRLSGGPRRGGFSPA